MEKHFSKFIMKALCALALALLVMALLSGCVNKPAPENRSGYAEDKNDSGQEAGQKTAIPEAEAPNTDASTNADGSEDDRAPETGNATGSSPAEGTAENPATAELVTTVPETFESGPVLETAADGVLVRAPVGYSKRVKTWERSTNTNPDRVTDPLTAAIFEPSGGTEPPGGNTYAVWAFPKREGETLEEWRERSSWGDSFFPDETVTTANGKIGIVYETNDFGLAPIIHVMIPTTRFVYRIDWEDERMNYEGGDEQAIDEAIGRARDNHDEYFTPPAHFLNFVRALEVK